MNRQHYGPVSYYSLGRVAPRRRVREPFVKPKRFSTWALTAPAAIVVPSPPGLDWEVRLFDKNGLRKRLPTRWLDECSFELLERGGFGKGSLSALATWEQVQLLGTEYADVYLFGELAYRGHVRVSQNDLSGDGERVTPTLYGLMERLGAYQVRCRYAYTLPVDISEVFEHLISDHVKVTNRLALTSGDVLQVDAQAIGVEVSQFDAVGSSVAQAINRLCDLAPNQCIWGFDVDSALRSRVYLRPRPTATAYRYIVGGSPAGNPAKKVEAFTYPRDTASIVNRIYITGGPAPQPNLVHNGSFEHPQPASETVGNLLADYSFEEGSAAWLGSASRKNNPAEADSLARTGTWWMEMDQDGEYKEQTVAIDYREPLLASVWFKREDDQIPRSATFEVEGLDVSSAIVATKTIAGGVDPGENVSFYTRYRLPIDFADFPTVTQARVRVRGHGGTVSNDGILAEDVALIEVNGAANDGWKYMLAGTAKRVYIDWANHEIAAYHGCYSAKVLASGAGPGPNYLVLQTTQDHRIPVKPSLNYTFGIMFQTNLLGAADIVLGVNELNAAGGVHVTNFNVLASLDTATWGGGTMHTLTFTANALTVAVELLIRVHTNTPVWIDGVMFVEGSIAAEAVNLGSYWEGDTYERVWATSNSALTGLTAAVSASITDYGEQEAEVSHEAVTDYETSKAFATGYFNARATPNIEASLSVKCVEELVKPDGLIRLLNLPDPPAALFPARVGYSVSDRGIDMDVDLGNKRPELSELQYLIGARDRSSVRRR